MPAPKGDMLNRLALGDFSGLPGSSFTPAADVAVLTAASGTASLTVADVTTAFVQGTLNNNFKSIVTQLNAVISAMKTAGLML